MRIGCTDQGVTNYEIDPASIAVNRRARRAKTDPIDLDQLLRTLLAYLRDEPRVYSMVHVPAVEDEARDLLHAKHFRPYAPSLGEATHPRC